MNPPSARNALDAALQQAWSMLLQGAHDRRGAANTPTLASTDASGLPSLRVLVLRACAPSTRELLFHTDVRSAKVRELRARPHCALLVYDAELKIQLRMSAQATVHEHDALAEREWDACWPASRLVHGSPLVPGAVVDDPQVAAATLHGLSDAARRQHFAVLRLVVTRLEYLHLATEGHRRAVFEWSADQSESHAQWLVP